MRNSSLDKRKSTEDVTELKSSTEVGNSIRVVAERSIRKEVEAEADMDCIEVRMLARVTSECEKHSRQKPKVSYAM